MLGQIIILNGAPRAGKSSIASAIQESFGQLWMNLGVDLFAGMATPSRFRPGIGLRPGGERPDIEAVVPVLYAALYESIAAHSRLGLNVVADVGHHDGYVKPRGILVDAARRLAGLPVLFVGVRCPIDVIMERRRKGQAGREGRYLTSSVGEPVPPPVERWQREAHVPGLYDLEVDTSRQSPIDCAHVIRAFLEEGVGRPSAFERLAAGGS